MKKLSQINETSWGGMVRRSSSEVKREEDKHRFDEPFKIIKASEHIDLNLPNGTIWTPFNFGSDSIDKPGYYMNLEDIIELREYLKDTDYTIANPFDFQILKDCYSKWIPEKIGNYYGFDVHNIHILNFGYISEMSGKITGKQKNDTIVYGDCMSTNHIHNYKQRNIQIRKEKSIGWVCGNGNDKVQVRLIKHK